VSAAAVRDALAAHSAAKLDLERRVARRDALQARFRAVHDRTEHAANSLRCAAADGTEADLASARQAYIDSQAADAAFQLECEGVEAAVTAAESEAEQTWRTAKIAAAQVADELLEDRRHKARKLASELRAVLVDYRALVRFCNDAVAPNEIERTTETGEPFFQRDLRVALFEPAAPEEMKAYSVQDFTR
jgi:hypothetical protein